MSYIKLTNTQKRTAELFLLSLTQAKHTKTVIETKTGNAEPERQAILGRKPGWNADMSPEATADALIKGDPEIDTKSVGQPVQIRSTVYLNQKRQPVTQFRILEDKHLPDGTLKESKPYKPTEKNVELPIQVLPKGSQTPEDFANKFVVHKIYQVIHTDGLSFDFLFNLCKEIESQGFVRLGAGVKANEPLILRREGLPCFGFLRGKVEGDKYLCTLHLTHTELKKPAAAPVV